MIGIKFGMPKDLSAIEGNEYRRRIRTVEALRCQNHPDSRVKVYTDHDPPAAQRQFCCSAFESKVRRALQGR